MLFTLFKLNSKFRPVFNITLSIFVITNSDNGAVSLQTDCVVSSSGNQDKIGTGAAKLADYEAELDRMIDKLVDMKRVILTQLEKLKDIDHYKVLKLRYVHCYTFERIATEMDYSIRNIWRIHGRALQAFEKVMNEGEG